MTTISNFLQTLSAIVTILTGLGWGFGVPEPLQKMGIEVSHLQIAFALSFIIAIGITVQKLRQKPNDGGTKKSQIQIGGSRNRQDMK